MQDSPSPSLYGDDESPGADPQPEENPEDKGKQTAVLPAEICPGMKVGDEIKLRIVSADEDSYEVSYDKGAEEPGDDPAAKANATVPDDAMSSMME